MHRRAVVTRYVATDDEPALAVPNDVKSLRELGVLGDLARKLVHLLVHVEQEAVFAPVANLNSCSIDTGKISFDPPWSMTGRRYLKEGEVCVGTQQKANSTAD